MPHSAPSSLADAQLIAEVRCRRCAYDLRGLSLDGRCPECGLEIWLSVQHTVDPAASRLPKLRDPAGVGNALLWLIFCAFAATLMLVAQGALALLGVSTAVGAIELPVDLLLIAGLLPLAAVWSVYKFAPPSGQETDVAVRNDLRVMTLALVGWGASGILLWYQERTMTGTPELPMSRSAIHLAMALSATAGLHGLRGVLRTIGLRSRAYRRAQGGRQGVQPMTAAGIGVAAGSAMRIAGSIWDTLAMLATVGTTLVWVCAFMLTIGLVYLLANAIWISRALHKPPPRLEDLIRFIPK